MPWALQTWSRGFFDVLFLFRWCVPFPFDWHLHEGIALGTSGIYKHDRETALASSSCFTVEPQPGGRCSFIWVSSVVGGLITCWLSMIMILDIPATVYTVYTSKYSNHNPDHIVIIDKRSHFKLQYYIIHCNFLLTSAFRLFSRNVYMPIVILTYVKTLQ